MWQPLLLQGLDASTAELKETSRAPLPSEATAGPLRCRTQAPGALCTQARRAEIKGREKTGRPGSKKVKEPVAQGLKDKEPGP